MIPKKFKFSELKKALDFIPAGLERSEWLRLFNGGGLKNKFGD